MSYKAQQFVQTNRVALFKDREHAGNLLARALELKLKLPLAETIVVAIPKGGIIVGYQIAHKLGIPLTTICTRKLGLPQNNEVAFGAVGEDGTVVLDKKLAAKFGLNDFQLHYIEKTEQDEVKRRVSFFRNNKPLPELDGKTVLLVDDGIATGYTLYAAIAQLKKRNPQKIIIAAPVATKDSVKTLSNQVDKVITLETDDTAFYSVGQYYEWFPPVSSEDAKELLKS